MAARGVRPQVTSKIFNPTEAGADHGLRPERIARQLHASLDRLGVAAVDLYLAHDFDPDVPLAETLQAFADASAAGLIRGYGVSNFSTAQLEAALTAGDPQAIQNGYSLLTRADDPELLRLCQRRDVAYIAYSPLAGGWLTGKYRRETPYPEGSRMTMRPDPYQDFVTEQTFERLDRLAAIAIRRGTSMAGLALAWVLADERVTQTVVGPSRPAQLAPVAEAMEQPLTDRDRAAIEAAFATASGGGSRP
jgi:aryl-alcohol dehydrogenase-like predicted oxidoreductase